MPYNYCIQAARPAGCGSFFYPRAAEIMCFCRDESCETAGLVICMTREQMLDIICGIPIFRICGRGDINFTKVVYKRGDTVTDRPGGVPCVGIVTSGEIGVYSVSDGERRANVSVLSKPDMFGICNVFAHHSMPTRLECISKCTVAYMLKEDFARLLRLFPDMALKYAELCNEKILFLAGKLEFLSISSARKKLCLYLLRTAGSEGLEISVSSKELLAMYLGISRASLFRELAYLRDAGAIIIDRGKLIIKDVNKLNIEKDDK